MGTGLYVIVFISGASVLAIEILGTRVLGPFYGVSLFLWSALITVTLVALSIGYALGGRWADRGPRVAHLGVLLGVAGLWLLGIPLLKNLLLRVTEPLGLRAAVLGTSLLLFAPPLTLLGMVSPYAIRLKASSLDAVGRTAGDLYAVSTVASVVAALLTGFYLIPLVGVTRLLLLVGVLLLVGATLAFLMARDARVAATASLAIALVAAFGLWRITARQTERAAGLVQVEDSSYAEIRVLDVDDLRYMLLDGGVHTAVYRHSWRTFHPYVPVVSLAKKYFDRPGRLLVIGLGGGSVVKEFAGDGWSVDAVEIDPSVIRVAREHFGLGEAECNVFCKDGRRYLRETSARYDVIVLDAYGSSAIPFHLVTSEVFQSAASRLSPEGILVMNVETRGWDDVLLASITATLQRHFAEIIALPTNDPPDVLGNIVVLASQRSLELPHQRIEQPQHFLDDPYMHWYVLQGFHAWFNRYRPETRGALVLTDERNPVDVWAEEINRVARRALHDELGEAGFSW
jgi:spermidine synthase